MWWSERKTKEIVLNALINFTAAAVSINLIQYENSYRYSQQFTTQTQLEWNGRSKTKWTFSAELAFDHKVISLVLTLFAAAVTPTVAAVIVQFIKFMKCAAATAVTTTNKMWKRINESTEKKGKSDIKNGSFHCRSRFRHKTAPTDVCNVEYGSVFALVAHCWFCSVFCFVQQIPNWSVPSSLMWAQTHSLELASYRHYSSFCYYYVRYCRVCTVQVSLHFDWH